MNMKYFALNFETMLLSFVIVNVIIMVILDNSFTFNGINLLVCVLNTYVLKKSLDSLKTNSFSKLSENAVSFIITLYIIEQ